MEQESSCSCKQHIFVEASLQEPGVVKRNGAVRLPWPAVGRPPPRPKALMKRGSRDRGVEGRGWEGRAATTCTASRCVYGVLGVGTSSLLQAALSFRRRSWPTFTLGAKWHRRNGTTFRPCSSHLHHDLGFKWYFCISFKTVFLSKH